MVVILAFDRRWAVWFNAEKADEEVGAAYATKLGFDASALVGLIPEEEHALCLFLLGRASHEDGLQCVGVVARSPHGGGCGHGRRCEVLHLFEVEIEFLRGDGQLRHVLGAAARVGADEVGDELLAQAALAVDLVEASFEVVEQAERGLAHELEHAVGGVLRCYLEASADVARDEFACVVGCGAVEGFVLPVVEQQVVAHAASDEALLDIGQGIDSAIDVEQGTMVAVEVGADLRVYARRTVATLAGFRVLASHSVHVRRGTAEVGKVATEAWQLGDGLHFAQDAFLGAAHDGLALVGGDGAEGTAPEAAAMEAHREADHVVGGYALAFVARVGQARVRQVEGVVKLLGGHGRVGRIDHDPLVANGLDEAMGVVNIALLLDMMEVLGVKARLTEAVGIAVEYDVVRRDAIRDGRLAVVADDGLWQILKRLAEGSGGEYGVAFVVVSKGRMIALDEVEGAAGELQRGLLAHTIEDDVGAAVEKDAGAQAVLPVVVVREAPQGRLDAAKHYGDVGEQALDSLGINDGWVFRTQVVATVGRVGILGAQAACSGVFVDHRIHATGCYTEPQPRTS